MEKMGIFMICHIFRHLTNEQIFIEHSLRTRLRAFMELMLVTHKQKKGEVGTVLCGKPRLRGFTGDGPVPVFVGFQLALQTM